jgi:hypothetical protein
MITINKINIYIKYTGEIDAFATIGTTEEKNIISDEDWMKIDNLLQDIKLLKRKLVSNELRIKIEEQINNSVIDSVSKELLFSLID